MNRLAVALLSGLLATVVYAAPGQEDADKDISKFCYHEGKSYSQGGLIFSPDKKDQLICMPSPHSLRSFGADEQGKTIRPLLQWVKESALTGSRK